METKQETSKKEKDVSNKIVSRDEVERLIEDYGHKDSGIAQKGSLDYLRSAKSIAKVRVISFPMEGESRVDAIIREYKAYSLMKPTNYNRFAFCMEYSMNHPLVMDEEQRLRSFFQSICPKGSESMVFTGVDSSLKEKVLVTIISSK